MTPETIEFLSSVLDQVSVSASDPNFELLCTRIIQARQELTKELENALPT